MEKLLHEAAHYLSEALERPVTPGDFEFPPNPDLGDLAYPCFRWSKEFKKNPAQLSQELEQKLAGQERVQRDFIVKSVGPYLNWTVRPQSALAHLARDFFQKSETAFGGNPASSRGTWIFDYSSPNIAKPILVSTLRSTSIGGAMARISRFRGYKTIGINHLGDWGTQYGKLAVAIHLFGRDLPENPTIEDLTRVYVKFHEEAEKRPELEEMGRQAFAKLEQGDPEVRELWEKARQISLTEFKRVYQRLGVEFDHYWGESHYVGEVPALLKTLRETGLLVESEGAQVVPVEDEKGRELPPALMVKADGSTIYATRDVAAAIYRYNQFQFDRCTYVVGHEQKLHFEQVRAVLRKMGFDWADRCEHLAFGLYRFKGLKMSTRKGNFVTLEDVIGAAKEKTLEIMKDREGLSKQEMEANSEAIAIGAVIFFDLSVDPARNLEFDVEKVVDFKGETGPYVQYSVTRCLSILRKAEEQGVWKGPPTSPVEAGFERALSEAEEITLAKSLSWFGANAERALEQRKPSVLAQYVLDIAKKFNHFYKNQKVLGVDTEIMRARLNLVYVTKYVLETGLSLLGVPSPEKM